LHELFFDLSSNPVHWYFENLRYVCPSDRQVKEAFYDFDSGIYSESNDCNKIAFRAVNHVILLNWCFGYCKVEQSAVIDHALCCFVNHEKRIRFFEPQTKKIFSKNKTIKMVLFP
jgi:hypothetical protein